MKCWICGADAVSGEHRVKASDIRDVFGRVDPKKPLFLHTNNRRNRKVRGIKAPVLKSRALICSKCNNERTQPHDRAWALLSRFLRTKPEIKSGDRIRLHKVFPGSVKTSMLYIHLFFLKLFGCQIAEHNVPINLKPFSEAILQNKAHPHIYLSILPPVYKGLRSIGASDVTATKSGEEIICAVWYYFLDRFTVRVTYAKQAEFRKGLANSWHPTTVLKVLRIGK